MSAHLSQLISILFANSTACSCYDNQLSCTIMNSVYIFFSLRILLPLSSLSALFPPSLSLPTFQVVKAEKRVYCIGFMQFTHNSIDVFLGESIRGEREGERGGRKREEGRGKIYL
jgi:hypothetical protein